MKSIVLFLKKKAIGFGNELLVWTFKKWKTIDFENHCFFFKNEKQLFL